MYSESMPMKEVSLKNGRVIKTPWLRPEEAAAYCGIHRTTFDAHAKGVPHGGDSRTRLYNVRILDAWLLGELQVPFTKEEESKPKRRVRMRTVDKEERVFVHPHNGKVFRGKE